MANTICIPIKSPEQARDEETIFSILTDALKDRQGELTGPLVRALDLGLEDPMAKLDDVYVHEVSVRDPMLVLRYGVLYSAAHMCRDIAYSEIDVRIVVGKINADSISFLEFVPPEARSTADEF